MEEYADVVACILDRFNREGLLREADPFTMKYLRFEINDILCRAFHSSESDYDVGYEEGYAKGKDAGYESGVRDYKHMLFNSADTKPVEFKEELYEFLEDLND